MFKIGLNVAQMNEFNSHDRSKLNVNVLQQINRDTENILMSKTLCIVKSIIKSVTKLLLLFEIYKLKTL